MTHCGNVQAQACQILDCLFLLRLQARVLHQSFEALFRLQTVHRQDVQNYDPHFVGITQITIQEDGYERLDRVFRGLTVFIQASGEVLDTQYTNIN